MLTGPKCSEDHPKWSACCLSLRLQGYPTIVLLNDFTAPHIPLMDLFVGARHEELVFIIRIETRHIRDLLIRETANALAGLGIPTLHKLNKSELYHGKIDTEVLLDSLDPIIEGVD